MAEGADREPSSTGLDTNVAGLMTYLLFFVSGIIFLILEKQSPTVRFHAYQSTITFGGLFLIDVVGSVLPLIGGAIHFALGVTSFILWIVLMVKAYQGERFKVPIVGDIADEHSAGA